jgi:predicted component of type VI protein secretion system
MTPEERKKYTEEFEKSKKAGGIVAPYEDISFDKAGNPMPKKSAKTAPKKLVKMTKKKS